jgi:hypothetical protein
MALQMSMVLFRELPALSASAIQAALAEHWPDLPAPTETKEGDGTISFGLGDVDVVLGVMPAPVPWSDLEGPCATSVLWPEAAAEVQAHQVHVIVTVSGELDPIELSTALTQATAAVMASSELAIGVFWTNAALLAPKALFNDFASEVLPLGPPIHIWVDFRVGRIDESHSAGFTTGMAALGLMELEARHAPEKPSELHERFTSIAEYLLTQGPVIGDGDTIGTSEDEKIQVVYSRSEFGIEGEVMRFVYADEEA